MLLVPLAHLEELQAGRRQLGEEAAGPQAERQAAQAPGAGRTIHQATVG